MATQPNKDEGPFVLERSDGCSGLSLPYRYLTKAIFGEARQLPFLHYCIQHDERYHNGGSLEQRRNADYDLVKGVISCASKEEWYLAPLFYIIAIGMLIVTRTIGSPFLPTPFRWNHGEPYTGTYQYTYFDRETENQTVLTEEDANRVMAIHFDENSGTSTITESIKMYLAETNSDLATNELKKLLNKG